MLKRKSWPLLYSGILFFLQIFSCLPLQAHNNLYRCRYKLLATIAGTKDEQRSEADNYVWQEYKNSPRLKPRTIDFSRDCMDGICQRLVELSPWGPAFGQLRTVGMATNYEAAVISLKKGDTVVFDGEKIKLGEFIGFGNATHIFALADNPDLAIRIPIIVPGVQIWADALAAGKHTQQDRLELVRSLIKKYVFAADNDPHLPQVVKSDSEGRYVIVKRIHGKKTGINFLDEIHVSDRPISQSDVLAWEYINLSALNETQVAQATSLYAFMNSERLVSEFTTNQGRDVRHFFPAGPLRQFLWDEDVGDWAKVDVE
jgi:hypothetical protein